MNTTNIKGTDLIALGYPESSIMALALEAAYSLSKENSTEEVLALLSKVLEAPEAYKNDLTLTKIAEALISEKEKAIPLILKDPMPYKIYGKDFIEEGALAQMNIAVRLPVSVAGALMPDAHQGYGLPIGGVLATRNAVIPYGVGVDIGCRMCLSVYDIPEDHFLANEAKYKRELIAHTKFGAGQGWHGKEKADHAVLEHEGFKTNPVAKGLLDKAYTQLGSSGGGNHFVEWGIIELEKADTLLNIPKGKYLALLTHSGSRGLGATIANHYTRLAKEVCALPREAANLAYLDLNKAEGMEYWAAMNLAGDYASACHHVIHDRLTKAIGGVVLARVENHHNFAWKEIYLGEEVIVHRKGATPAAKGVMGIIPGSMTAPGFLVRGKGVEEALNSASHGAGRQMSRTQAEKTITSDDMKKMLKDHGVTLIGGGIDEAPMAYKDINTVMKAQTELIDVVAKFTPKLVRMADDGSKED
jgi:tRNA-splicing ligase RtcB